MCSWINFGYRADRLWDTFWIITGYFADTFQVKIWIESRYELDNIEIFYRYALGLILDTNQMQLWIRSGNAPAVPMDTFWIKTRYYLSCVIYIDWIFFGY